MVSLAQQIAILPFPLDNQLERLYYTNQLINLLVKLGKSMTMMTLADDQLTQTFAALANNTRRAILARLAEGEATVNELAEPFAMSLPAISKHIKVLERAGLVVQGKQAQYRPCSLDAAPLQAISHWTDQYRPLWEASFDRMDAYIEQLSQKERENE